MNLYWLKTEQKYEIFIHFVCFFFKTYFDIL